MKWFMTILSLGVISLSIMAKEVAKSKAAKQIEDDSKYASYTIKKGTAVTVDSYDEKYDIFTIIINEERSVGPNLATSEEFRKAIEFEGTKDSFAKQRQQMIGSEYQLKRDLQLLTEEDLVKKAKSK